MGRTRESCARSRAIGGATGASFICSVHDVCEHIVDQSSYMWKVEEGDYRDDITVIVLMVPWVSEEMKAKGSAPAEEAAASG